MRFLPDTYLVRLGTAGYLLLSLYTLTLFSVAAAEVTAKPAKNPVIVLDANGVKNLRIETEPVEERDFEETAFTLGRIEAIPRNIATLSSRIPGRVVELKAAPGEMVTAGDIIARIESRQPGDPPPVIALRAPISGMVTRLDVHLGDPVDPDKTLLEITDLREVYAVARVPEYLAGRMKPSLSPSVTSAPVPPSTNAPTTTATIPSPAPAATPAAPAALANTPSTVAHITAAALPNEKFDGTLLRFGTSADKESGTLDAVFRLTNSNGLLLRPGMRAEFSIVLSRRAGVLSVPKISLQGEPANRYIYVRDFDLPNAFIKTPVVVGETNDRFVELISGVLPVDEVVTRGA
ncbi:MAG: efflux RND transporter periplasmic adaptor subunit, partial [Candidatus Methylacidiphilales bacterium]